MAKGLSMATMIIAFLCIHHIAKSSAATATEEEGIAFVKAECRATRYPALCVRCLSNYSSSIGQSKLAQAALSVSLSQVQSASTFISKHERVKGLKPREYQAVGDCIQNMGDTVDQLSRSTKELGITSKATAGDFGWHLDNVQTWVSAALTNENICLYGFARPDMDGRVKVSVRRTVVGCAQVTSIALSLVNCFAATARHYVITNAENSCPHRIN